MDSIFGPIFDALAWLLAAFYSVVPNLGISIILLTFFIMLLLYPLTAKQAKSMIAMQRVQPEIKKLQAKYKGDRQKLNEEMMKFYQENKINPLAGCLPLLVQLPIFISLFNVLRDPQKYVPTNSSLYHALCDGSANCAKGKVNAQYFLGMNLEVSATDVSGFFNALPYFIMVALVGITGYMSVRQAQKRTPAANKQMAMVMKVLPIAFTLFSLSFPAGLVLYFVVSNLWRLGQQELIFRRHGSAHHPSAKERRETSRGTKASVIEAESRDVTDDDGDGAEPAGPKPVMPAKRPAPKTEATPEVEVEPDTEPARAASVEATPAKRTGGLRSFFQLPPPPEPNGGSAAAAPARTRPAGPSASSSPSSGAAPSQQRRRRNKKKKRKR